MKCSLDGNEVTSNRPMSVASKSGVGRKRMKALVKPATSKESGMGNLDNPKANAPFNRLGEQLLSTDSDAVSGLASFALLDASRS